MSSAYARPPECPTARLPDRCDRPNVRPPDRTVVFFRRKRDRILITILSRSLSSGDRERVTQMLKTTGHEAAHRREHGTALNLGAGTRSASTAPVARPKLVISSPVTGSFRRVPLEESMPGVVAAQTPIAEVCENSNETVNPG